MKIFPSGLEINDREAAILKEEIDDIEGWVLEQIANKVAINKEAIKVRWTYCLQNDESINSLPKKIDDLVLLIMSRPWFRNRQQRLRDQAIMNQSKFTVE